MQCGGAALQRLGERVVQQRARAGEHGELGDPAAHRAGADDADDLRDGCPHPVSALMPVAARPMISFWICEVPSYRVVTRTSRK